MGDRESTQSGDDLDDFNHHRLKRLVETKIVEVYGHLDAEPPEEFTLRWSLNDSRLHVLELSFFKHKMPEGCLCCCFIQFNEKRWIHPRKMTVIA